jgi:hypothetical protein
MNGSSVVAIANAFGVTVAISSLVEGSKVVEIEVCRCVVASVVDSRLSAVDVILVRRVVVRVVDIMIKVCVYATILERKALIVACKVSSRLLHERMKISEKQMALTKVGLLRRNVADVMKARWKKKPHDNKMNSQRQGGLRYFIPLQTA